MMWGGSACDDGVEGDVSICGYKLNALDVCMYKALGGVHRQLH